MKWDANRTEYWKIYHLYASTDIHKNRKELMIAIVTDVNGENFQELDTSNEDWVPQHFAFASFHFRR
jgi:hypothetical protein